MPKKGSKRRGYGVKVNMAAGIYEDLTGKQYTKWIVGGKATPGDKRNKQLRGVKWFCRCDCSNTEILETWTLTSGWSKSCGCLKKDLLHKMEYGLSSKHQVFSNIQKDAKRRSLIFNLSFERFVDISKQKCYYCGVEPSNYWKRRDLNGDFVYQGMDRVDSSKGYTIKNVVPCCKICNRAESNMTKNNFLGWVDRVHLHQGGRI